MCINHPDRPAIGICVITKKQICQECSTQYEGVNYSKEGLEILMSRRAATVTRVGVGERFIGLIALLSAPILLFLLYYFYVYNFEGLANLIHNR